MRFDDRLSTVLGLSAEAPRDRAVQWRQLVELVARASGTSDPTSVSRALDRIRALSGQVPDAVRVAAAKAIAGPAVPPSLLACFLDRVEVAAPLLAKAEVDEAGWAELRAEAAPDVRDLMDSMERVPPAAGDGARVVPEPPQTISEPSSVQAPGLFRWECGPTGEIDWVDGAPRAALIGRSLAEDFGQRFAARLPFGDEPLVVAEEGELAGEWRWSGTPAFFPDTGRFAGYRGSARRGDPEAEVPATQPDDLATGLEGDRLRELIHELRTPLNAIIGFGEIIEGQILGPAHRAYRDRAAEIVRQARRLLAAVDDLDLAAKLQSGRSRPGEASDVACITSEVSARLESSPTGKGVRLTVVGGDGVHRTALQHDLATRLLQRFIEAVSGAAADGEELTLTLKRRRDSSAVTLERPRALRGVSERSLLDAGFSVEGETGLGTGFALRLVRGLAIVAGGGLEITPDGLTLLLRSAQG